VLRQYAALDPRVRPFAQANAGPTVALNHALGQARGEWICWLSSDDLFLPGKLAAHDRAIAAEPGARFFHTHFHYLDDATGAVASPDHWHPIPPAALQLPSLLAGNWVNGISVAVHREAFARVGGFDERLRYGSDFEMWLRLATVFPPRLIDERLCVTRIQPAADTSLVPERGLFDGARACLHLLNRVPFEALFPLLDLADPAQAAQAVQAAVAAALRPDALMYTGVGAAPALLDRLREWLGGDRCPPPLRAAVRQALAPLAAPGADARLPAGLVPSLRALGSPHDDGFRYAPYDGLALLRGAMLDAERAGRAETAAVIAAYLVVARRYLPADERGAGG
jgi:hypothetical protein